tara:strand:- start:4297 stop:4617 length:321 start_codon:yes stop_codon:yes gene_type:complete
MFQNYVGPFSYADLWEHIDSIIKGREGGQQSFIFSDCILKSMAPVRIIYVNLAPRRGNEDAPKKSFSRIVHNNRGSRCVLKRRSRINQTSIEKYPASSFRSLFPVT